MRPVNLLPGGKRGSAAAGGRNIASYAIIGALVLILGAVSLMATYDKKTNDNRAKIDSLKSQIATAQAEATSLSSFTDFQEIHDARVSTIDSLAKSRFDWERVMRELAIVVPDDVWLTNLTGTASPTATVENGAGLQLRASVPGPALELTGCALNQRTVARLIAAVNDIDGVTRVLVSDSSKPEPTADATTPTQSTDTASTGSVATTCAIRPSYPSFELVAAFDGVTPPADASADPAAATPTAATPTTTTTPAAPAATTATTTTTTTTPDDGGVAQTAAQNQQQQGAVGQATQTAQNAAQIPTGGK